MTAYPTTEKVYTSIAEMWLGDGSRYSEIKALNSLSSDTILPGQELKLPKETLKKNTNTGVDRKVAPLFLSKGGKTMTERERIQIRKRRSQGQSMEAIASSLGLNRNTVKSYCMREGITPSLDPDQNTSRKASPATGYCESCHKPIEHIPKQKPKRFCSDLCRYRWWGEHRQEYVNVQSKEHLCAYCKASFHSPAKRKYCSHPCYIKARFGGEA